MPDSGYVPRLRVARFPLAGRFRETTARAQWHWRRSRSPGSSSTLLSVSIAQSRRRSPIGWGRSGRVLVVAIKDASFSWRIGKEYATNSPMTRSKNRRIMLNWCEISSKKGNSPEPRALARRDSSTALRHRFESGVELSRDRRCRAPDQAAERMTVIEQRPARSTGIRVGEQSGKRLG